MTKLKIADAHTHIYPAKIADKATNAIGEFYNLPMGCLGDGETLLAQGGEVGITRFLVCSVATSPAQVRSINDFLAGEAAAHPQFVPFAAMHQDYAKYEAELDRIKELGFYGVKFHPDFQKFDIDDEKMIPMYKAIAERGLKILFHMGDDRYDFSAPERLRRVVERVPGIQAIAAHFGGYRAWEKSRKHLKDVPVMFDTSSSLFMLEGDKAVDMICGFGPEKFMFATDFPMWPAKEELGRFLSLGLPEDVRDMILWRNFERYFGVRV